MHTKLMALVNEASLFLRAQQELAKNGAIAPCPDELIESMKLSIKEMPSADADELSATEPLRSTQAQA